MTYTFTVVATCESDMHPEQVAQFVHALLGALPVTLIPCGWAPDPDTIGDNIRPMREVTVIDMNPPLD